jgi:hypothetical protein
MATVGSGDRLACADVVFKETTADAGEVRAGQVLVHRFAFVNKGTETADIVEVRTSCGCLKSVVAPSVYRPGEHGEVRLEINTLSEASGPNRWQGLVIYQLDGTVHETPLTLTGKIVTEIVIQPAAIMLFGDGAAAHDAVVTDLRAHPFSVERVSSSSPELSTRLADTGADGSGHRTYTVRFALSEQYPVGRHEETIAVYTDDPAYPELRIPVTILKRPRQRLTAAPAEVSLRALPGQAPPSRIVLIRDLHDQEIIVDEARSDNPAIVCRWAKGPGTMVTLRISVDRSRLASSRLQTSVRVRIRQPVADELIIPVSCELP